MRLMSLPTLLLVDDDHEFVQAQTVALGRHFKIVPAQGVHSSLDILKNNPIDCVLVDYYLTDGNGHQVARWIAENMPWCPVVLVSAGLDKNIAIESFAHRVFDVLEKPYGLETALAKLNRAVSEARLRKQQNSQLGSASGAAVADYILDSEKRTMRFREESINLTLTEVK
ncbi:MAG: response regulator, partial [Proteobacteria bacterium]